MRKLTAKQHAFVQAFLVTLNATKAAIQAGYSEKNAGQMGHKLLQQPAIEEAIQAARLKQEERTEVTIDWITNRLVEVVDRCMQKKPVMRFDPVERCMVQATETDAETGEEVGLWTFDSKGANTALDLLGKSKGMFSNKLEITGKDGGPVEIKDLRMEELLKLDATELARMHSDALVQSKPPQQR